MRALVLGALLSASVFTVARASDVAPIVPDSIRIPCERNFADEGTSAVQLCEVRLAKEIILKDRESRQRAAEYEMAHGKPPPSLADQMALHIGGCEKYTESIFKMLCVRLWTSAGSPHPWTPSLGGAEPCEKYQGDAYRAGKCIRRWTDAGSPSNWSDD